jgi:hypothetical protein
MPRLPVFRVLTSFLVVLAGTAATPAEAGAAGSAGTVRSFWLHMNSTPTTGEVLAAEAGRRDHVVLNAWEGHLVPELKAANPDIQVFVYKDLSSTRSYACRDGADDRDLPTGIGYCDADDHHPEWFLLGPDGKRFEYSGYPGHWQMDVGDPGYQQAWADNVVADSTGAGFDGVFMDNALFSCDAYHVGVCPREYPTDAAIQGAYRSMLANLGAPAGPYRAVADDVFRRDFACGAAVVNARRTGTAPVTVELGGRYLDPDSATVTSVALPGTSGAVLRKPCPAPSPGLSPGTGAGSTQR